MAVTFNPQIFISALRQGYLSAGVPGPMDTPDGEKNPAMKMANGVGGAINQQIGTALLQLSDEITALTSKVASLEQELKTLKTTVANQGGAGGAGGALP